MEAARGVGVKKGVHTGMGMREERQEAAAAAQERAARSGAAAGSQHVGWVVAVEVAVAVMREVLSVGLVEEAAAALPAGVHPALRAVEVWMAAVAKILPAVTVATAVAVSAVTLAAFGVVGSEKVQPEVVLSADMVAAGVRVAEAESQPRVLVAAVVVGASEEPRVEPQAVEV